MLRDRLRNGVEVYIGYGFGRDGSDDYEAVIALERLAPEYPNFTLRRIGDSHAKVLICDDYVIVTSFNWLSFVGDPARTFRDERGMLVRRPEVVAEATERLMSRFNAAG